MGWSFLLPSGAGCEMRDVSTSFCFICAALFSCYYHSFRSNNSFLPSRNRLVIYQFRIHWHILPALVFTHKILSPHCLQIANGSCIPVISLSPFCLIFTFLWFLISFLLSIQDCHKYFPGQYHCTYPLRHHQIALFP